MVEKKSKFSEKYESGEKPDPVIKEQILRRSKKDELACGIAFEIAHQLGVEPSEVGKTADLLEYRLVKCQLGLFGYQPGHRIVQAKLPENEKVIEAIKNSMVNGRIPCKTAWKIAAHFNVHKMTVSNTCEALNIKIKPCQLGAF